MTSALRGFNGPSSGRKYARKPWRVYYSVADSTVAWGYGGF